MGWNYLSIPKLQRFLRWSLGTLKKFRPTHYNGCDYLSMLGLKLIHDGKRAYCSLPTWPPAVKQCAIFHIAVSISHVPALQLPDTGTTFTHYICSQSWCTPTRIMVMIKLYGYTLNCTSVYSVSYFIQILNDPRSNSWISLILLYDSLYITTRCVVANKTYPSDTHVKLNSLEISFVYTIRCSNPVVLFLNFTQHGGVPYAKFESD